MTGLRLVNLMIARRSMLKEGTAIYREGPVDHPDKKENLMKVRRRVLFVLDGDAVGQPARTFFWN
jgi:hypothetical protein